MVCVRTDRKSLSRVWTGVYQGLAYPVGQVKVHVIPVSSSDIIGTLQIRSGANVET